MRSGLVAIVLTITLVLAPPAFGAGFPNPTLTSSDGQIQPPRGSYCNPQMCGDAAFDPGPDFTVTPGTSITLTLDADADDVHAYFGERAPKEHAVPAATGPRQYTIPIATGRRLPTSMTVGIWSHDELGHYDAFYTVRLVAPPAPVFTPTESRPQPSPAASVVAGSLKLAGRRLVVSVECPATASTPCSGLLTLKTPSMRVTRLSYAGVQPGTRVDLRARVRAAIVRHLKRYRTRALRSVLTPAGGAPVAGRQAVQVRSAITVSSLAV